MHNRTLLTFLVGLVLILAAPDLDPLVQGLAVVCWTMGALALRDRDA